MTAWYEVENVAEVPSPALLVYPDRVQENLRRIIAIAGGTARLRPHVKTHKLPQIIRLQIEAGIDKFKCATIAEAEMVAEAGAADVLLAYQPVGPHVPRLIALVNKLTGTTFSTIVDDAAALAAISQAASEAGLELEVLVDIDNGMHRTGIEPGDAAFELYQSLDRLPGVRPGGLHVYDGHVRDPDLEQRIADAERAFEPVQALCDRIAGAGLPLPRLVCGGTPTFPVHARHTDRECSPGTCVFWDASYAGKFPDLDFVNAALVLTRVISKPAHDRLCFDLGYKAIACDNPDPRVLLQGIEDAKMVNHSEEHLAVQTAHAAAYRVGDAVYGIPFHVCPTTALHREVIVVENGRATGRWPVIARDRLLTV